MTGTADRFKYTGVGLFGRTKQPGPDKKYASFNRRMLAATIDSLVAMLLLAPVLDYLLATFYPLPPVDWTAIQSQISPAATDAEANRIILKHLIDIGYIERWADNFLLQFIALSIATGICWHFWAATPGKLLLKLRVVDAETEAPISDTQIILRLLGYVVSTLALCAGFFWIGIDKRRQSWHDKLAGTVVIIQGSKAADPSASLAPSATE